MIKGKRKSVISSKLDGFNYSIDGYIAGRPEKLS